MNDAELGMADKADKAAREQEALLNRLSDSVAVVMPLSDGSFAVFSNDRTMESMIIVDTEEELAIACNSRANMLKRKTPSKGSPVPVSTSGLFEEEEDEPNDISIE